MPAMWWLALGALVLNDHVLKGSGLLPPLVTGKLSDFAGLIVAPVLACTVFGARSDRARIAWLAITGIGFAAIKVSPMLAHAAGQLLTALGIRSRIWCDPTDLLALAVLPLALQLARRVAPSPRSVEKQWSRRIAIGIAALACVATSDDGPSDQELSPPFVVNWTLAPVHVTVARRAVPCADPDGGTSDDAPSTALETKTAELSPAHILPIGWALDMDGGVPSCGDARIRVGAESVRVTWDASVAEARTESVYTHAGEDEVAGSYEIDDRAQWAFDLGVTIVGAVEAPRLEVGERLREEQP